MLLFSRISFTLGCEPLVCLVISVHFHATKVSKRITLARKLGKHDGFLRSGSNCWWILLTSLIFGLSESDNGTYSDTGPAGLVKKIFYCTGMAPSQVKNNFRIFRNPPVAGWAQNCPIPTTNEISSPECNRLVFASLTRVPWWMLIFLPNISIFGISSGKAIGSRGVSPLRFSSEILNFCFRALVNLQVSKSGSLNGCS